MLEKDEGIVLGAARSGDTSVSVRFLGRRSGKVRLVAKGAMRPQHPAHGILQPGHHVEVIYYRKENRSVYFIKEATLLTASTARESLDHLAALLAATELLEAVCYAADAEMVDTAIDYVRALGTGDALVMFLAFELRLLESLGASPQLATCAECGQAITSGSYVAEQGESHCKRHRRGGEPLALSPAVVDLARACASQPLSALARLPVDAVARKQLGKIVHWTYTHHVQGYNLPKSLRLI